MILHRGEKRYRKELKISALPVPENSILEVSDDPHYLLADRFRDFRGLGGKHEHLAARINADVILPLYLEDELRALDYLISLSFESQSNGFDIELDVFPRNQLVQLPTARPDGYELAFWISG